MTPEVQRAQPIGAPTLSSGAASSTGTNGVEERKANSTSKRHHSSSQIEVEIRQRNVPLSPVSGQAPTIKGCSSVGDGAVKKKRIGSSVSSSRSFREAASSFTETVVPSQTGSDLFEQALGPLLTSSDAKPSCGCAVLLLRARQCDAKWPLATDDPLRLRKLGWRTMPWWTRPDCQLNRSTRRGTHTVVSEFMHLLGKLPRNVSMGDTLETVVVTWTVLVIGPEDTLVVTEDFSLLSTETEPVAYEVV
ncbi:hypothetical protein MTO96_001364 [Rhipicephalus appendiculatus]